MKTKLFQIVLVTLAIVAAITCNMMMLLYFVEHHEPLEYVHAFASFVFSLIQLILTRVLIDLCTEWRDKRDEEELSHIEDMCNNYASREY